MVNSLHLNGFCSKFCYKLSYLNLFIKLLSLRGTFRVNSNLYRSVFRRCLKYLQAKYIHYSYLFKTIKPQGKKSLSFTLHLRQNYHKKNIIGIIILSSMWNIVVEKNYTKHFLLWFECFMWELWDLLC